MNDQLIADACYIWTISILKQLEQTGFITAAELERVRSFSEQHYQPSIDKRVMFYADEFGTLPEIQSAEMMFSAARSRRLSIVAIIQSYQQLEKNYGREGAAIICDNTQLTIAGGFAPGSESAERTNSDDR